MGLSCNYINEVVLIKTIFTFNKNNFNKVKIKTKIKYLNLFKFII